MIEEERYIIEEPDEATAEAEPPAGRFPVRTQLLLLASLMFLLFAGVVVPKTLSLISGDAHQAEVGGSIEISTEANDSVSPKKIEGLSLRADAVYVWDVIGQRALYEENPDKVLPLASITKLMTALVAYELVPDDTPVTISRAAAAQQSGGSLMAGETFAVKELADFALISSYNSAGDFHEAFNTNSILADIPNLLGSKTGYTDLAGGNLTIAFDAGFNRPIIVTVLGSTHSERFSDVKKIVAAVLAGVTSK